MTVTASAYEWRENEFYETEEWVTRAILRHFDFNGLTVWEPSAGAHRIARVLTEHGANVITSDIANYTVAPGALFSTCEPIEHDFIFDFFQAGPVPFNFEEPPDAIFTNPPFGKQNRLAVTYCRMALKRCAGWVIILCTAKFDFGSTRNDLFKDNSRFHAKINLTDRLSFTDDGKTGTEDHAIYVWRPVNHPVAEPVVIYEGKER